MFKTFVTLVRGAAAATEENLADRHALEILNQQVRDARAGLERGRQALAIAVVQDKAEARHLTDTRARIADLEGRALEALRAGRQDLAEEAADAIAVLEEDGRAIAEAHATLAGEVARLRQHVAQAERRFADVERGRRLAQAADAVQKLRSGVAADRPGAALADAERTLQRLRERQREAMEIDAELAALDAGLRAETVVGRLAAEGFGPRVRITGADVLGRLRARAAEAA